MREEIIRIEFNRRSLLDRIERKITYYIKEPCKPVGWIILEASIYGPKPLKGGFTVLSDI